MAAPPPRRYITRHDDANNSPTHGWHVRIRRLNWYYRKFFADNKYGGKDEALAAAQEFRDELIPQLEEQTTADRRDRMTARNTSGLVGVRPEANVKGGIAYDNWMAYWTDDEGERQAIRFSVNKYGKRDAKALARVARDLLSTEREVVEAELERRRAEQREKLARRAEKRGK